jgi:hypothetical protein
MDGIQFDNQANEPDVHELLEIERTRRLDEAVRAWFMFKALEASGNQLADQASLKYHKIWEHYKSMFTNVEEKVLIEKFRQAKVDFYYNEFAVLALGYLPHE